MAFRCLQARGWAVCAVVALLTGCVTLSGAQLSASAAAELESAPLCCTEGLSRAPVEPLPNTAKGPVTLTIDAKRPAHAFDDGKAFFVLLELPPFAEAYSIEFTSDAIGPLHNSAIFVPLVVTLDAAFQPVRRFGEDSLRQRGQQLERTVFFNPSNRGERYVAVYGKGAPSSARTAFAVISTSPVVAGNLMFNLVSGNAVKGTRSTVATGTVRLLVKGTSQAALR